MKVLHDDDVCLRHVITFSSCSYTENRPVLSSDQNYSSFSALFPIDVGL